MTAHASMHIMVHDDQPVPAVAHRAPGDTDGNRTDTFIDVHIPGGYLCLSGPPEQVLLLCRRLHHAAVAAQMAAACGHRAALAVVRDRIRDDHATMQALVTEPGA